MKGGHRAGSVIVMDMMSPWSKKDQIAALTCRSQGAAVTIKASKIKEVANRIWLAGRWLIVFVVPKAKISRYPSIVLLNIYHQKRGWRSRRLKTVVPIKSHSALLSFQTWANFQICPLNEEMARCLREKTLQCTQQIYTENIPSVLA